MFKFLVGVTLGVVVGFKYAVTKIEVAGYTRDELVSMKDDCERLHPRTIHCVPVVKYKAVGVPKGGRNVPQLKSYDPSLDTDAKVFDEPVTHTASKETYEYTAENADPILLKSWDEYTSVDVDSSTVEKPRIFEYKIKN